MNYTDLLTIAMPVYERKDFFVEALESAINQTIKCKIIVIDNCSSHNYYEQVCKEKGITYYRNDENIGMMQNFNRCFELATTEYVMTLQDDDILSLDYVESFYNAVKMHPDIDIFYTDFVRNTQTGKLPHSHTLPFGYMSKGEKVIEYGIKYRLGFPYPTSSIRRSKFSGFYTKYQGSNDWMWIYENADKLSFYGDSRILYQFRDHENQDTRKNLLRYQFTFPYIYDAILKKKVSAPEIQKKAAKRALWEFVEIRSNADNSTINEFLSLDNIFSHYLHEKLENDRLVKTIFSTPRSLAYVFYKSLIRLKLYR